MAFIELNFLMKMIMFGQKRLLSRLHCKKLSSVINSVQSFTRWRLFFNFTPAQGGRDL